MLTNKRLAKRGEGGFTLIELLIVVVILGILVAIVLFAVGGFTGTSAQAACKTDMKQVGTASSAFYAQKGSWPGTWTDLTTTYLQSQPPSDVSGSSHYSVGDNFASPPTITGSYDNNGTTTTCGSSIIP